MSKLVDNLVAFKIIYMLVTPFEKTEAFKLGIVDKDGNALKKTKDLKTNKEREAYTQLDKLVFSLKRILGKLPGGKSQLASIVTAYWLIKESYPKTSVKEAEFDNIMNTLEDNHITLVEEELEVEKFLKMFEDGSAGAAIANVTGGAVSTNDVAVKLKKNKPVSGILGTPNYVARRKPKQAVQL